MKIYKIESKKSGGQWHTFMHWHGLSKGYATGAFRMLRGFKRLSETELYRLVCYDPKTDLETEVDR